MSFVPSSIAQAVAVAAGNNQATLASSLPGMKNSIAGGNLGPAAFFDGLRTANSWTAPTLLGSWSNYGSGYNPAGYFQDAFGIVHLRGLVQGGTQGTTVFTLPSGSRPANQMLFVAISNNLLGRIGVDTSGNVIADLLSSPGTWISLDGMTFGVF